MREEMTPNNVKNYLIIFKQHVDLPKRIWQPGVVKQ